MVLNIKNTEKVFSSPPQCCTDTRVVIEEDEERDEEVCQTVEDDIAGHPDLGKVTPATTKRDVCVTSHLQNKNENIVKRFNGKR